LFSKERLKRESEGITNKKKKVFEVFPEDKNFPL